MPRTSITATQATRAGTTLPAATAGDTANGNSVQNDGRIALVVENTGAGSHGITFHTARTVDGLTGPVRSETIPASARRLFGPFPPTDYGTTLNFNVANAELTVQAIRI